MKLNEETKINIESILDFKFYIKLKEKIRAVKIVDAKYEDIKYIYNTNNLRFDCYAKVAGFECTIKIDPTHLYLNERDCADENHKNCQFYITDETINCIRFELSKMFEVTIENLVTRPASGVSLSVYKWENQTCVKLHLEADLKYNLIDNEIIMNDNLRDFLENSYKTEAECRAKNHIDVVEFADED